MELKSIKYKDVKKRIPRKKKKKAKLVSSTDEKIIQSEHNKDVTLKVLHKGERYIDPENEKSLNGITNNALLEIVNRAKT